MERGPICEFLDSFLFPDSKRENHKFFDRLSAKSNINFHAAASAALDLRLDINYQLFLKVYFMSESFLHNPSFAYAKTHILRLFLQMNAKLGSAT